MAAVAAFRTMFSPHLRKHPDDHSSNSSSSASTRPSRTGTGSHHARPPPAQRARSTHHHPHGHHSHHGHHGHGHGHAAHRASHPPAAAATTIVVTTPTSPKTSKLARAATVPAQQSAMATKVITPTSAHRTSTTAPQSSPKAEKAAEKAVAEREHERRRALDFVAAYADDPARMRADGRLGRAWPALGVRDFGLLKTLGTGTFARVWLARLRHGGPTPESAKSSSGGDHDRDRVFALKILRKADIIRMKQVEHVRNERLTLSAVAGSPFVTTLAATFADADSLYMLLDYCPGGEIFTYLRRAVRFQESTARFYAAEITLALEHLHTRGITYRDLKPENMLLDARGHLKLVDFGFAKLIGKTETYTLCGTPEYLAPEVIHNTGHGTAVDWWALGILLYEFLVGNPPFWDPNPLHIYHKIVQGRIPFPPEPDPAATACPAAAAASSKVTMSRPAKDLIQRLCAPSPAQRLGHVAGGAARVREHAFFRGVDWQALRARKGTGPLVPKVAHAADGANFDDYPDPGPGETGSGGYTRDLRERYEHAFRDF